MKHLTKFIYLVIVTALLAGAFLALQTEANTASAQGDVMPATSLRTIHVSSEGALNVVPDHAIVTLGVESNAEAAADALAQNNEQAQALLKSLREAGVAKSDIQTQQLQLYPRYQDTQTTGSVSAEAPALPDAQPKETSSELIGYTAKNTVRVRVRDLDNLGTLIDTAVEAGSNRIEGIQFAVSDDVSDLLDEARIDAWQNAEHKAQRLAEMAGGELGDVVEINEYNNMPLPVRDSLAASVGMMEAPIEPGTQTVSVRLDVTWELISMSSQ